MEIGQVNVAANQIAPERQTNGQAPVARSAGTSGNGSRDELANALAAEVLGPDVKSPNELRLRVEEDINTVVATVVNRETEEVVRTLPPEELVTAAKKLNAILGQILDREV